MIMTAALLKRIAARPRADLVAAIADNWHLAEAAGITTPLRAAHFLARIMVETGGLRAIEESLDYSAKRLVAVWPSRFPSLEAAKPFAGNPEALADKVYGGRLGNTQPGDGWRYRGSGMLQTTGRANFRAQGFEGDPDALRQAVPAFLSAVKEWVARGCNALADRDDVVAVCKAINGGTNGLADQRAYLAKAKAALAAAAPTPPAVPVYGIADLSPSPAPPMPPAGYDPELEKTQRLLEAAGYPVGKIDGRWGEMTRAALRGFKASYNDTVTDDLPLDNSYGKDVQLALLDFRRPVAPERAEATARTLRKEGDAQVSFLTRARNWAAALFLGAPIASQANTAGLLGQVEQASGLYQRASAALAPFAPLADLARRYWWLIAIAIGLAVVLYVNGRIRASVATYRAGLRA